MRQRRATGSRMVGSGGMTLSRVTEERERAWGPKIAKCGERARGLKVMQS
jgi:hypothetical protein